MSGMDVTHPCTLVVKGLFAVILATHFINLTYAEDGAGVVRQLSYRGRSSVDGDISHTTTVPKRSRLDCAATCLSNNCSVFQYNATAHLCHLYSDQPGGEGLQDDSRIYTTANLHGEIANLYGDTNADWLLFLRRQDGSVDFNRHWADYLDGFGNSSGEFWLGLETLHMLTANQPYKLRAEVTDWDGNEYFSEYSTFQVDTEINAYTLSVSGYDGNSTAGNSMGYHNGLKFTTLDVDNDGNSLGNCAVSHTGGWWYVGYCYGAHPTGTYFPQMTLDDNGVIWKDVPALDSKYSFKTMMLMIKP